MSHVMEKAIAYAEEQIAKGNNVGHYQEVLKKLQAALKKLNK